MEYETIILELMSRIQKLEVEVSELKNIISISRAEVAETEKVVFENQKPKKYEKMTDEMISACYEAGKRLHAGEDINILAEEVETKTRMNRASAIMYIYAVFNMLNGEVFKRAINSKALRIYLDRILKEFGVDGLQNAIVATRAHVEYRKSCGHTVDSISKICDEYESKL